MRCSPERGRRGRGQASRKNVSAVHRQSERYSAGCRGGTGFRHSTARGATIACRSSSPRTEDRTSSKWRPRAASGSAIHAAPLITPVLLRLAHARRPRRRIRYRCSDSGAGPRRNSPSISGFRCEVSAEGYQGGGNPSAGGATHAPCDGDRNRQDQARHRNALSPACHQTLPSRLLRRWTAMRLGCKPQANSKPHGLSESRCAVMPFSASSPLNRAINIYSKTI